MLPVVHSIAPNLLGRQFAATGPNQKWAVDFTNVWTAESWLFVTVVLALYPRRVVGWSMQSTMSAQLVMDTLLMAIFRRGKPQAFLHHANPGSQGGFTRYYLQHEPTWELQQKLLDIGAPTQQWRASSRP